MAKAEIIITIKALPGLLLATKIAYRTFGLGCAAWIINHWPILYKSGTRWRLMDTRNRVEVCDV